MVPRRAIAGTDIENIEVWVIGHGVPNGAAAAGLLPTFAEPSAFGLFSQNLVRGRAVWLTLWIGGRIETPGHLAGCRIIG